MSKYKKVLWVALAVLFLVIIILSKTTSIFENNASYQQTEQGNGLSYDNVAIENLVKMDTDLDGVLDWEEGLWGTDPTKKETTAGTPDGTVVTRLKAEQIRSTGESSIGASSEEKLTQTDQFSRELFSTVATLSQSGQLDEATIEALTISLAEKIQNPATKKIFLLSDLKIVDDSAAAVEKYITKIDAIYLANPLKTSVTTILKEFVNDGENVNLKALSKLDAVIKSTTTIINELIKMNVPRDIASIHLDLVNTLQKLKENITDIQLFNTDPIVAIGAVTQYDKNTTTLESVTAKIGEKIIEKLSN